jgi:hypothetical protein
MTMWELDKQTCGSLQKFVIMLSLDFMPLDEIANISMNDLRRRVETCDKTLIEPQMNEPLVSLDLGHWVSVSGAPPLSFCFLENHFLEDLQN